VSLTLNAVTPQVCVGQLNNSIDLRKLEANKAGCPNYELPPYGGIGFGNTQRQLPSKGCQLSHPAHTPQECRLTVRTHGTGTPASQPQHICWGDPTL